MFPRAVEAKRATLPLVRTPRSRIPELARTLVTSAWTLGTLVFVLTWGGSTVAPETPSIDGALQAGLNMAAVRGLDFGPDVLFTYGPLGFLKSYLVFYEWPTRLALLYGMALHFALSVSLVWALRRHFGAVIALAVALVAAVLARGDQAMVGIRDDAAVVTLTLIWCVAALSTEPAPWIRRIVVYGGGVFAAVELLAKLNTGLIVLGIVAITVIAIERERWRNLAILAATLTGSLAVLWFASGQGVHNIASFISGSVEVIRGYSSGARLDWGSDERQWDYWVTPLVLAAAIGVAWVATRRLPRARRAAALAIVAVVAFTATKAGWVSHDYYHMATFYATVLGLIIALPLPSRPEVRAGALIAIVGTIAAGFTTSVPGYPLTDPIANLRNGASAVARLVDTEKLERVIADNRAGLQAEFGLDQRTLELLDGGSVHVDPSEASAAWAYDLEWHPLPIFQPYAAWTEELDQRNAGEVASDSGPELILRQNLNALGRYPAFESPAAMLELLCHFTPLRTTPEWQVLERVGDRCGEPEPLASAEAAFGEPVPVPPAPAESIVFARVDGVADSGLGRLRTLIWRPESRQVQFGDDPAAYTFITGTAQDGLLLRAPAEADSPEPFTLAPNSDEVTFLLAGGPAEDRITVDFYSMPVRT
jgi:hypothetical protein